MHARISNELLVNKAVHCRQLPHCNTHASRPPHLWELWSVMGAIAETAGDRAACAHVSKVQVVVEVVAVVG